MNWPRNYALRAGLLRRIDDLMSPRRQRCRRDAAPKHYVDCIAADLVTVHALVAVPIPVGHRVEVRVFVRERGRNKREPAFDEPLITDLETGVVYGADWHFRLLSGYRPGTVQDLPVEPRADLAVHSVIVGTVSATRVSTVGSGEAMFQQTTLRIAPAE